ncbi:hypothetical protein C0Q70_13100 [Pomacea canaliculata]|uniref:Glycoside hydrolase family 5 domain-containing protein n=1 Tax=Pomacea canaliculata TaxID=400727 RepID=A0A2T7NWA8_POMCA|nr:hypothetical protein C0Q70_13100 [Pomacea canaliculata]
MIQNEFVSEQTQLEASGSDSSTLRATCGFLSRQGTRLVHNGQHIFLSGANTAWVSYAHDFGNHQYPSRRARFLDLMNKVHAAGGNSMRTWVHIEGETSPKFDSTGHVIGLDTAGTFLAEFKEYLDDAHARHILIFPTLWNGALKQHNELGGLITDTSKLQSYIDKALIPWVRSVMSHPALGGWDIINEMEGVIRSGEQNSEPCFDTSFMANSGAGWAGASFSAQQLLRFINWQADAIRRTDPSAMVTAGSWSQKSQSDHWGDRNLYSDHCLVKAGGRAQGTLTFYSTHTYDWQGQFPANSPFKHNAADYGLDKPLVVAEFNSHRGGGMSIEQLFQYAYNHGYAGAWSWHANADGSDTDDTNTQIRGITALRGQNGAGGLVTPLNF